MIFGYLKVKENISHAQAFCRPSLRSKRMGKKMPNGNIIVDATGGYNRFDAGAHRQNFEKTKMHYVIGDECGSRMHSPREIRTRAPEFLTKLRAVFGVCGERPIDIISRKGRVMTSRQVKSLLRWPNRPTVG
jgi:hypothetical protein